MKDYGFVVVFDTEEEARDFIRTHPDRLFFFRVLGPISETFWKDLEKGLKPTPCRHEEAVKWNAYNGVVQCHKCGQVFTPKGE